MIDHLILNEIISSTILYDQDATRSRRFILVTGEYSYNFSNSKDHRYQPYLQGSSGISLRLGPIIQLIPHRTPVALFWDLFRGLHLTSWRWMARRRINYPHDLLGASETLQLDYPRIPPDDGWSTFSAMTHYLQLSSTFCGPSSPSSIVADLHYQKSPRYFAIKNLRGTGSTICSVMGYQHLAKLCRLMGCSATLLKPH